MSCSDYYNQEKPLIDKSIWGLDHSFKSYRKLLIYSIKNHIIVIKDNNLLLYYYNNHPISRVEVIGIITSIKTTKNKINITIDDGSQSIHAMIFKTNDFDYIKVNDLFIGCLISIKGMIYRYENDKNELEFILHVKYYQIESNSNEELLHWTNCVLYDHLYYRRDININVNHLPNWIDRDKLYVHSSTSNQID